MEVLVLVCVCEGCEGDKEEGGWQCSVRRLSRLSTASVGCLQWPGGLFQHCGKPRGHQSVYNAGDCFHQIVWDCLQRSLNIYEYLKIADLQAERRGLVHSLNYLSRQRQPGQKGRFLTSVSTSKLLKVLLIKAQCRQPGSSRETFNDWQWLGMCLVTVC